MLPRMLGDLSNLTKQPSWSFHSELKSVGVGGGGETVVKRKHTAKRKEITLLLRIRDVTLNIHSSIVEINFRSYGPCHWCIPAL